MLLGKIWYNAIFFDKKGPDHLESNEQVNVQIIKASTEDGANAEDLSIVTANLTSKGTSILLPQPILIRPNFFYTICAKKFPKGHFFKSFDLESSVVVDSDGKIEFHNDKTVDGKIHGMIYKLAFNEI